MTQIPLSQNVTEFDGLKEKRIVVVEDDPSNRAITKMLLEKFGARVYIDPWGRETLQKMQQFAPINIVILDLMLSGTLSGYDIFKLIRQVPEFNTVPIVAVSAADASTALPKAQTLGFSGYISKPIDFHQFPRQIARIIAGQQVWYTQEKM